MILVLVGSHPQGFERLLNEIDRLVKESLIKDVFVQSGYSDYLPKYFSGIKFLNANEMQRLIRESDFVIAHAGAGIIMDVLRAKKKLIVVPRYKKFGEHSNNHQLDITRALEEERAALAVYNIEDLEEAIKKIKNFKPKFIENESKIIPIIEDFLNKIKN